MQDFSEIIDPEFTRNMNNEPGYIDFHNYRKNES